jgi:hypothetical protein
MRMEECGGPTGSPSTEAILLKRIYEALPEETWRDTMP